MTVGSFLLQCSHVLAAGLKRKVWTPVPTIAGTSKLASMLHVTDCTCGCIKHPCHGPSRPASRAMHPPQHIPSKHVQEGGWRAWGRKFKHLARLQQRMCFEPNSPAGKTCCRMLAVGRLPLQGNQTSLLGLSNGAWASAAPCVQARCCRNARQTLHAPLALHVPVAD